ncbi:MAG TPA: tRNA lysidine(34) synthetase TilS [Bacteroidales bacterium]|nr:tRNA lysidine(34) synthetase TilS [Bacteroidales bacterium]
MISKVFNKFRQQGIKSETRLLCAVSGGVDSTVMLHVLNDYGFDCIVAHCNFKLRGQESDEDERFVQQLATNLDFKFLCETFETEDYAKQTGLSIQMAARDLRYQWFYEMAEKYKCTYIALAHNSDDQAETVITNMIRGTGIRGLCGMKYIKNKLFRPLLEISRSEIEKFAKDNAISFRTDSTNITVKYSRNKIRHKILPLMKEINSSALNNILESVNYLNDTEKIFRTYIAEYRLKCLYYEADKIVIDLKELKKSAAPKTMLFEILLMEGIPKNIASESVNLLEAQAGKFLNFLNISILKDRNKIIIDKKRKTIEFYSVEIQAGGLEKLKTYGIKATVLPYDKDFKIVKDSFFAYLDYDRLKFPLIVRKWQDGDRFQPFGMKNFKKLSDFLKDEKFNLYQKSDVLLVESDDEIVWIVGIRADNRFRITENTKKVLILEKI